MTDKIVDLLLDKLITEINLLRPNQTQLLDFCVRMLFTIGQTLRLSGGLKVQDLNSTTACIDLDREYLETGNPGSMLCVLGFALIDKHKKQEKR